MILKCQQIYRQPAQCAASIFYRFTSLKLESATDEDAEDVIIHFSQGEIRCDNL